MSIKRKLIEVSLPLEAINIEAAREKSIRHGHPSTLHLWWARRPLAAARAVLFAQLVDDPSSNENDYRAEAQRRGVPADRIEGYVEGRVAAERERLHEIIRSLVAWENINNEALYRQAHDEILKSTGGDPPPILDPFAGGGTIPLEAQRLGLEALASDLNPVSVLINKALIEIAPTFSGRPPVFPGAADSMMGRWPKAKGLAEDVRRYGAWMRDEAEKRIGALYPKAVLADGSMVNVSAWMWARTVECPNPGCLAEVPLIGSTRLSTNAGRPTWLSPVIRDGQVYFEVTGKGSPSKPNKTGQGAKFDCWVCASPIEPRMIHDQLDLHDKPPNRLLCIVAEGQRQRLYLNATDTHQAAADAAKDNAMQVRRMDDNLTAPTRGTFGGNAQGRRYGFFEFADYFTDRQLIALTTFSDLIGEARERVLSDAIAAGYPQGERLSAGGIGASAYADAIATYLGFTLSKMADRGSSLVSWVLQRESTRNTFARQAISMAWDFVEMNPLLGGTGSFEGAAAWTAESIDVTPWTVPKAKATQGDAATIPFGGAVICTDPPYYDNIVYSDMSDFFYVWLRRSLREVYPELLSTILVPKAEELVANAYRHGGKSGAQKFFEEGFNQVFARARESANADFPITVFYAFKQTETKLADTASTGWQTLLEGMIKSGWTITGTWPVRSERADRTVGLGSNALASSIVLALRTRSMDAAVTTRRGFLAAMKSELPTALRELQQGAIAPVDLAQAAIGPGMAVFSRYGQVVEADGSAMSVRTALALINHALDEVLAEQEGDFDGDTRFCVKWFTQFGWATRKYGDAETLANSVNISVPGLVRGGVFQAKAGEARLVGPSDLSAGWDPLKDERVSVWEATLRIAKCLDQEGGPAAAVLMALAAQRVNLHAVHELAYLLYNVCERAGRSKDALLFNGLGTSWADLATSARRADRTPGSVQGAFDFDGEG